MFNKISWSQYILVLLIALVFYYAFVLLRYYRGDIRRLFSSREPGNKTIDEGDGLSSLTNEKDFPAARELVQSLSTIIQQASQHNYIKEELIMSLSREVQKYPKLKGSAFQVAVNNQIEINVSEWCKIKLDTEDLKRIWS